MAALATSAMAVRAAAPARSTRSMMVWNPIGNKFFETFSFLPPLSDTEISKQIDYCVNSGYTPCIEFQPAEQGYTDSHGTSGLDSSAFSGYYDNRYWTMWKLPMFGCSDSSQVLTEIANCAKTYPACFVRVVGFDAMKQVQCVSFLVHRPAGSEAAPLDKRSL
uniref:Ribulose bisphosphate carboxylase small subunit, chloroplastic n=1 Tax=Coccolithus braarudii TaxID=221442 RepID=A0A7S0Q288_9EUKA